MNESSWKATVVKKVKDAGGYARRIEDQYAVGTPDMVTVFRSVGTAFVEWKIIRGMSFGVTPRQLVEIERIEKAGGTAFMAGWKDNRVYFARAAIKKHIDECYSVDAREVVAGMKHYVTEIHNAR